MKINGFPRSKAREATTDPFLLVVWRCRLTLHTAARCRREDLTAEYGRPTRNFLFCRGPAPNTLEMMSMKACKGSACKDLLE